MYYGVLFGTRYSLEVVYYYFSHISRQSFLVIRHNSDTSVIDHLILVNYTEYAHVEEHIVALH